MADPDDYERRYMDADRALLLARVRQHPWLRVALLSLMGVALAFFVQQVLFLTPRLWELRHEAPLLATVALTLQALCGVLLLAYPLVVLAGDITRVALTPTQLRVHRGLATTDVPLHAITRVAVETTARWFPKLPAFGGFYPRNAVYQGFRTKQALRVEWRDEKGRARCLWVYLEEAESLRERIESLRSGTTGVRVDPDEEVARDEREEAAPPGLRRARG